MEKPAEPYVAPHCFCPKRKCERHGKCQECVEHHRQKGEMPYCAR